MAVTHDLELNTLALQKAMSGHLVLPAPACANYQARREKFGERVDGAQFKEVATLLGPAGSTHSICSPEKYPSDKLDYLVGDAQLDFVIPEYDEYDKLEVTKLDIVYASGETKTLTPLQFTYSEGHITLVDPIFAKNLVELKVTYKAYEK